MNKSNHLYEEKELREILFDLGVLDYEINSDGSIDVISGDVIVPSDYKEIPVNFNHVAGSFMCHQNINLKSLKGSPKTVGKHFICHKTKISSLEGSPEEVGSGFSCYNTPLKDLVGAPKNVYGDFDCDDTKLTTLRGLPNYIGGDLYCINLNIENLYEYRYALFSFIGGQIKSSKSVINELINEYGYDGSEDLESKKKVLQGLKTLRDMSNENK